MARQWVRVCGLTAAVLLCFVFYLHANQMRSDPSGLITPVSGGQASPQPDAPLGKSETSSEESALLTHVKDWTEPPGIKDLLSGLVDSASGEQSSRRGASVAPTGLSATGIQGNGHPSAQWTRTTTVISTHSPSPSLTATSTSISKAIVMGKISSEDTDWVAQYLPEWQSYIYVVDLPSNSTSPTGFRTKMNKSKEAMPYLTYIIDHYPNFPDVMVFIHAHRMGYPQAWHNDARNNDAVEMLQFLRTDKVLERGYVNLRCQLVPGCPDEIKPYRDPPDPEKVPEQIYPFVYAEFFNMPISQVRERVTVVATPCCAQFAVSREQILKRPKADYEHYRAYLEQTSFDDDIIGRVLEYMWHIIFGRDSVHCDAPDVCYCEVYGRCNSRGRRPGRKKAAKAQGALDAIQKGRL